MVEKEIINKITIDKEGNRYIKVSQLGIPNFLLLTANFTYVRFEGEKTEYISLSEAIKVVKSFRDDYSKDTNEFKILNSNIQFLISANLRALRM